VLHGEYCARHLEQLTKLRVQRVGDPVNGFGLIATAFLTKGTNLLQYTGDMYDAAAGERYDPTSRYVLEYKKGVVIDASRTNSSVARLINDPKGTRRAANAVFVANYRTRAINVRLIRDVHPDEPILIRYGRQYWAAVNRMEREKKAESDAQRVTAHRLNSFAVSEAMGVSLPSHRAEKQTTREYEQRQPLQSTFQGNGMHDSHVEYAVSAETEALTKRIHPQSVQLKDPVSYWQIKSRADKAQWQASRKVEMHNHLSNHTCVPVPRSSIPARTKLLTWREVYKLKKDGKGEPTLYKSRFTLRGCARTPDQYGEVTAYVFNLRSLRIVCAAVAIHDWEFKQLDYTAAFLQSSIDEELYAVAPQDLDIPPDHVLRILKAIYGLKQAANLWQQLLFKALGAMGYKPLWKIDCCIFIRKLANGRFLLILVYVDDMPYAYCKLDVAEMDKDIATLQAQFDLKLMGDAHQIVGWRVIRNRELRTLSLDMQGNIENALEDFGLTDCRSSLDPSTPWSEVNQHLLQDMETPVTAMSVLVKQQVLAKQQELEAEHVTNSYGHSKLTAANYRHAIGTLLWITTLVPAIMFMTCVLARSNADPQPHHIEAVKRVFRYLAGVKETKLTFHGNLAGDESRVARFYTDSDYGADTSDSKSFSGYVVMLAGAALTWYAKKQTTVAKSTSTAETIAACALVEEIEWVVALLAELNLPQPSPSTVLIDNKAVIDIAKGKGDFCKSRHIRLKYHLLQDLVMNQKVIELQYIQSDKNLADLFTKPKTSYAFRDNVALIMGKLAQARG